MPQIDGGIDPSCDSWRDNSAGVKVISVQAKVKIDGRTEEKKSLEITNGNIAIGEVQADQKWTIELHYDVASALNHDYSIRYDFKDIKPETKPEGGACI